MNDQYEYECALSGLIAPGAMPFLGDDLHDLPPGWIEVRMSHRIVNPRYALLQQVKEAMATALMGQFAEEVRESQGVVVRLQIEAQFYQMEQDIEPYLTEVETVYLAPPEVSEDVAAAVNQVREMVGLEALEMEEPEPEPPKKAVSKKVSKKSAEPEGQREGAS